MRTQKLKGVCIDQKGDILLCTKQNTIVLVCQERILHETRSYMEIYIGILENLCRIVNFLLANLATCLICMDLTSYEYLLGIFLSCTSTLLSLLGSIVLLFKNVPPINHCCMPNILYCHRSFFLVSRVLISVFKLHFGIFLVFVRKIDIHRHQHINY